jgi:sterol desaturase/sphingolipid hydroxylase (fatty acid hydroxylase superfamily)
MSLLRLFARYAYVPFMLIGINGCAVMWAAQGVRLWKVALLLVLAIAAALLMERVLPYEARWNTSHGDAGKDAAHGFVYELSSLGGLVWLQLIAWVVPWQGIWPREWPLGIQLLAAIFIADLGATLVHYASHRVGWLWSLHCVHHGVHRLYGFNGLVRIPCISRSISPSLSCRRSCWACRLPSPYCWAWPFRCSSFSSTQTWITAWDHCATSCPSDPPIASTT